MNEFVSSQMFNVKTEQKNQNRNSIMEKLKHV